MPNWCSNTVTFSGESEQLRKIKKMFVALRAKEKAEHRGQLPSFIKGGTQYFFYMEIRRNVLNYETRWSPNTDVLKQVADHFGVGFYYEYVEPMNGIHGKVHYAGCKLTQSE